MTEAKISNTQKVVKGVSSQTLVTIVLGVVEIGSFAIMSRLLTQQDFGYYAAITAITSIFATFSETGIGSAIVQQKELTKRYIDNAFTISLLFGIAISLALFSFSGVLARGVADESMKVPLMLMSATLLLQCLTSVNTSLIHRKRQFLRLGTIKLIALVVTTAIAIFLAYKGYGYYAIIIKAVLSSILTYILSLFLCRTRFGIAFDFGTFKKIFSFSGWLMASAFFKHLAHQIDRLLMPRLLSVTALGEYNRPKDFIEQISNKLNDIFDTALFPVLSGIQDNLTALKSAFKRSMSLMNTFGLLLTLAFFFNSGLIIHIFFGEQWMYLKPVMMIISCSLLFNVDGRIADCYLRSLAMTKQQFYFRMFEFALKTLGVVIGFKWGIEGVALSVVITNLIAKLVKILFVGNKIDVSTKECLILLVSSWRYSLLLLPICLLSLFLLPETWGGELLLAAIFTIVVAAIFLLLPKLVGIYYELDIYSKLKAIVIKKMSVDNRKK